MSRLSFQTRFVNAPRASEGDHSLSYNCSIISADSLTGKGFESIEAAEQLAIWQPQAPDLFFAPVPDRIALAPDRVFLKLGEFTFGIQLTEIEAHRAIERLSGFRFDRLNQKLIWTVIERVVGGAA